MPPKKGPKLTKKQIEEQKKEAARLQKEKEEEEAAAERDRLAEEARIQEIELQKMLHEERIRIVGEKEKKFPMIEQRIKSEKQSLRKLLEEEKWSAYTTPYSKDYNIEGTNLETFASIFRESQHKNPRVTLDLCDECEIYITKLEQAILQCRANYDEEGEKNYKQKVETLQQEILKKLEEIMIQYSNYAEEMQEKNVEENKKKNEQNAVQKAIKPTESIFEMSENFKIGMYINTGSTKGHNRYNPLAIREFGFNTEVPPKWSNNTAVIKFQWTNFNAYAADSQQIQFRIVGGVFNLQFYDMFVGTKRTNNISIKKFYKGREILQKFKLPSSAIKEPFKVMYEIPSYIFLAPYNKNNIKIAQFDLSNNKWSILPNDAIVQYEENEKRVTCKVSKPEPIAFVENKCADFPYVAWELRTVEKGKVMLDLELKRKVCLNTGKNQLSPLMLQFEIGPNVMKLNMDREYKEFSDLCQNYYTPEYMLSQLSKRGIHILPVDSDYKHANIKPKDRDGEKNAIRDIAYAVESFTIRSQPNDTEQIRVRIRQNLDYEFVFLEDQEKDWKKICWEEKDKCSVTNRDYRLRHMNLETLLEEHDFCEKECHERIKYDKQFLLRKTLMKVLELTRILAFTTADDNVDSCLVEKLKEKVIVE